MKTINIEVGYVEFTRDWDGNFTAEIHGNTPGEKEIIVKVKTGFACLSGILFNLRKCWQAEREQLQNRIARLDERLP